MKNSALIVLAACGDAGDAGKAIKDYEHKANPNLANLKDASKAYIDTLKSANAR